MTLLALIVACMLTHGHDWTGSSLQQYVKARGLSPWMDIPASQIHEFFGRLDCGFYYATLDFGLNIGVVHNNSTASINSNTSLEVAIATAWFQFFLWLGLALANFWLAFRMQVELLMSIPIPFLAKE